VPQGILSSILATLVWVVALNAFMHVRPAEKRFTAMLTAFLLSLPLVALIFLCLPRGATESRLMGLIHAYVCHLLLFCFYGECFYYVERSVTLRFFVELLRRSGAAADIEKIRREYGPGDMIGARLRVLLQYGYIEETAGRWRLKNSGLRLARLVRAALRLYGAQPPQDRC
jgi:hypothetical protein